MKSYFNPTTNEWYYEGQGITRRLSNGALFFGVPSATQLTEWGFEEQVIPEPTAAELLQRAIDGKIAELEEYDTSDAVNSFAILNNGVKVTDYWLDRDLRTSLEGDVRACKENGHSTYNFDIREMGITLPLDCTKFLAALNTLREYAYTAYNVTSAHMAAIRQLATIAEVEEYDFTTGYPTKLEFDVAQLM